MPEQRIEPYGSWVSPITADLIVSETIQLGEIRAVGDDIYWVEGRPAESGRAVIVRRDSSGATSDMNPPPFNARTRVHEYGGGAYCVEGDTIYFSNFADNRLYRTRGEGAPEPVTAEAPLRYADMQVDEARNRIICVREDHSGPDSEAINTLVAVDLSNGDQEVLVSGNDFYSTPRLHPDGSRLAWLTWNHPNMPWDGSELWVGELAADGSIANASRVAGSESESIFQPEWSPGGVLYFVSDRSGWWNLYRQTGEGAEPIAPMEAEFGVPQWVFGMSTYAFATSDRIISAITGSGTTRLASIDAGTGSVEPIETEYTAISGVRAAGNRVVFLGGSPTQASSIVSLDLRTGEIAVLRRSSSVSMDEAFLSPPEPIEFPTENGLTAHALYYAPKNPDFAGPIDEKPPLIVGVHGGPTGATPSTLDLSTQYWTSRGFAVLDVNYGGSTGYGREYRERLNGQWGVVDVDDSINGARYLADQGKADPDRLIIHGGSAGGYTTLAALAFRDAFAAGASYFGIADLDPFVDLTHKFESRYTERLVGPYPESSDLYRERSPINFVHQMSAPVILFQGLDDKIVPPNQAEIMVEGLQAKGIPYAYVPYEGEGHGFRRADNMKRTLESELYFYSRVFGFDLPEAVETVEIENAEGLESTAV